MRKLVLLIIYAVLTIINAVEAQTCQDLLLAVESNVNEAIVKLSVASVPRLIKAPDTLKLPHPLMELSGPRFAFTQCCGRPTSSTNSAVDDVPSVTEPNRLVRRLIAPV